MKSWHGYLGTLLLFLQLGNLCLPRGIALCCVPTPQHVLERRIGHPSPRVALLKDCTAVEKLSH